MKNSIAIFIVALLLLSACRKKCDGGCGANSECSNGQCQCNAWYEGTNCDTPMRQKFIGTFIGALYGNGVNPKPDTLIFSGSREPINYVYQSNLPESNAQDSIVQLIQLTNTTQGICYIAYNTPNFSNNINCGVAQITFDGHKLTLLYSPLIRNSGVLDTSVIYTFIGYK